MAWEPIAAVTKKQAIESDLRMMTLPRKVGWFVGTEAGA